MSHIKTAISIDEPIYREAEKLAREMKLSRSELFSKAIQDYLNRQNNRRLVENYNKVYSKQDPEEEKILTGIRSQQRKLLRKQWK